MPYGRIGMQSINQNILPAGMFFRRAMRIAAIPAKLPGPLPANLLALRRYPPRFSSARFDGSQFARGTVFETDGSEGVVKANPCTKSSRKDSHPWCPLRYL